MAIGYASSGDDLYPKIRHFPAPPACSVSVEFRGPRAESILRNSLYLGTLPEVPLAAEQNACGNKRVGDTMRDHGVTDSTTPQ